jgi:single-stranded DNA-binding protein
MTIECAFVGVLGREAEVKTSGRGKLYLKLNLRVAEGDDVQWVSVLSFDDQVVAQAGTFTKGSKCYVEGRISLNEWTAPDGKKRTGLACRANHTAWWRSVGTGDAIVTMGMVGTAGKPRLVERGGMTRSGPRRFTGG